MIKSKSQTNLPLILCDVKVPIASPDVFDELKKASNYLLVAFDGVPQRDSIANCLPPVAVNALVARLVLCVSVLTCFRLLLSTRRKSSKKTMRAQQKRCRRSKNHAESRYSRIGAKHTQIVMFFLQNHA